MDAEPANDQTAESPQVTLARTRKLLARSRATLDALAKRLAPHEQLLEASPLASSDTPS